MAAFSYIVYLARFPFVESVDDKLRPVIVVSQPQGAFNLVVVVPVSASGKTVDVDVALSDWKRAGLIKPSVARIHRLATMLQADLLEEIGIISVEDAKSLRLATAKLLNL